MTPTTRAEANARKPFPWYLLRRWLYGLAVAVGAILVYHDVIPPEALAVYLPLIIAAVNTNPPPVPGEDADNG